MCNQIEVSIIFTRAFKKIIDKEKVKILTTKYHLSDIKNVPHNYIKKSNSLLFPPIDIKAHQTITVKYIFQKSW